MDYTSVGGTSTGVGVVYVYEDLTFSANHVGDNIEKTYYMDKSSGTQILTGVSGSLITSKILSFSNPLRTVQLNGDFSQSFNCTFSLYSNLDLNGATLSTFFFQLSSSFGETSTLNFNGGNVVVPYSSGTIRFLGDVAFSGTFDISMTSIAVSGSRSILLDANFTEASSLSIGTSSASNTIVLSSGASDIINVTGKVKNIDITGHNGTLNKQSTTLVVYGNITTDASNTINGTGLTALSFQATSGTQIFTTNGALINCPMEVNAPGATVRIADVPASISSLSFSSGTLELPASQTVSVGSFATTGTTLKYLQSTSTGTRASISDSSGTNTVTYLSIKDNSATGGATWNSTSSTNVNAGNVTGWNFGTPANTFFLF